MPLGKTFDEYKTASIDHDPTLEDELRVASAELDLGIALQRLREERGLSQRALSGLCGIKQPMLVRIERGSQSPTLGTLIRLLRALNGTLSVTPDGRVTARPAEAEEPAVTSSDKHGCAGATVATLPRDMSYSEMKEIAYEDRLATKFAPET